MKKFLIIIGIMGLIFLQGIYAGNNTSKKTLQNENKVTKLFDMEKLNKFEKDKKNITEKLKNSSKEQAIELFNTYYKNTSEYLYENGDTMLDKSVREKSFSENEMKQINENFLNKYGLKLYHAGEGTFAVRTYSNFYYDIFKDYLSDDYKEYLKIIVKESEEPFASDGGVIIPVDELGDRIIVWENFMKKYPNLDKKLNINFLPGSRINIVAGFTGIFLGTKNQEINFLKGSVSKIQAGDFGIHVSSREYSFSGKPTLYFQNGSSIEVSANWAIKLRDGFIKLDKDTDDKDAPRVKVFGKRVAFRDLNFRVKDGVETDYGKMHLQATGHDLFEKVSGNLELVEGSVIEGNISKSENFSLKLKKGTKFYADEVLELGKMELKGDLFVGSKASYNNMDGYAGASDMTARVSKL